MRNIWHDIKPDRIKPDCFVAVIEIERAARKNTNSIKKPE